MCNRTKHTVDIDITTAAKLIGVDTSALFDALRASNIISRNAKGDNIATSHTVKLGYFINDLRHIQNRPTMPIYEQPLVTVWGMQFLRDLCTDKNIKKIAPKFPSHRATKQISLEASIARNQIHKIAQGEA